MMFGRRLSDRIIAAHTLACEQGKLEVAEALLKALEKELSWCHDAETPNQRKALDLLGKVVTAHQEMKERVQGHH